MDLTLSEEQEILLNAARDFLVEKFPREVLDQIDAGELGYSPEIWLCCWSKWAGYARSAVFSLR